VSTPLCFENVPFGHTAETVRIPAHHSVAVVGDVRSGPGGLAGLALGLEPTPPGGRVLVFDEEIAPMPRTKALAFRRRVGYVPAGDGLLQNLSLEENVALPLRFGSALSTADITGRLRIVLAVVRLAAAAAALRPADADLDQRRRAAVARALVFDPELVLLEQPFDGLSGRSSAELLEVVRGGETAEGGRRTVFITGRDLPERIRPRLETVYRVVRGQLTTQA